MKRLCSKCFHTAVRFRGAFAGTAAALAALLFAPACSDDDTEPPFVAVTSGSFTFSPDTAINTVRVEANTDWAVCWTPAVEGVVVEPASGSGDATLVVERMPAGASIRIAVCHGTGERRIVSNGVTVVRASAAAESSPSDALREE